MEAQPIANSYIITNRAVPWEDQDSSKIVPLPVWQNFYFWAPGANNANWQTYKQNNPNPTPAIVMPDSYRNRLEADIRSASKSGGPQVTVYIHGLAYYLHDACKTLGTFGQNLTKQGYKGLLIGFSWPSYGDVDSYLKYANLPYSFPPKDESGTIRANIHGSTKSLLFLLLQLWSLCNKYQARLNLVCHSEGNYMLMLAMYAAAHIRDPQLAEFVGALRFVDQTLLLAADINQGALEPPLGSPPIQGQGSFIAARSDTVTVYWSVHDDMLPHSDGWKAWHNPAFPLRLGLHGPASTAAGTFLPNAYSLDCSLVVKKGNPSIPPHGVSIHESYFYIPQVVSDMAQTLRDVPPANVTNRISLGTGDTQAFLMNPVLGPSLSPYQPLGVSVPEAAGT